MNNGPAPTDAAPVVATDDYKQSALLKALASVLPQAKITVTVTDGAFSIDVYQGDRHNTTTGRITPDKTTGDVDDYAELVATNVARSML